MIPEHYYKLICCPKCKTDLDKISYKNELYCQNCKSKYPVIEDIPILLHEVKDEISQIIKEFYDTEWKRNRNGILRAKVKHEDLSTIGQQTTNNRQHTHTRSNQGIINTTSAKTLRFPFPWAF